MRIHTRSRGGKKIWTVVLTVVALVLSFAGITAYFILGPPGPETIRDRAIRALESGDSSTLCRLADREELVKLNVTPRSAGALLRETFWRNGYPRHSSSISKLTPTTRDLSIWFYQFPGSSSGQPRMVVQVIDTPKIGWKLNLTSLLRSGCYWSAGAAGGSAKYRQLARKYDIRGLRQQEGEYVTLQQMEAMAAVALGGGR